jgi:hypothetical protein
MEKVTKEKQIVVTADNKLGMLAEVTGLIADQHVNIENFCAYANGDKVVFGFLTSDNEKAKNALQAKGYRVEETEVILLRLWNRSGSLASVTSKLKPHGIHLDHVFGTSSQGGERMTLVFSSDDNEKAAEVFTTMVIEDV